MKNFINFFIIILKALLPHFLGFKVNFLHFVHREHYVTNIGFVKSLIN